MPPLSAYGVDLTPPAPVSYSMSGNMGDVSNVMKQVNTGQNQANAANDARYKQMLALLGKGAEGLNANSQGAIQSATQGYGNAIQQFQGSLGNNATVFNNESQRATADAMKASSSAQQNAVSRGLTNTTVAGSMQDQVQRAKNDAFANISAKKAEMDNGVYQNLAQMYANQGNAVAGLTNQAGQNYMQGAGTIASAIQGRTDQGPNIGDYAGLVQAASAAKNSGGQSIIRTTDPISINSPLRGGNGGGISGGIASSMGQGGFASSGSAGTDGRGGTGGAQYHGPGWGGGYDPGSYGPSMLDSLPGSGTPGGVIQSNTASQSTEDPRGIGQAASASPAAAPAAADKPGGVGVYDGQNKLVGIRYPDGTFTYTA